MRSGLAFLGEAACRCRAGEVRPEDLPAVAAGALAAGLVTPALCELADLSRTADARDVREAFGQAPAEVGIRLPDRGLARRHGLSAPIGPGC